MGRPGGQDDNGQVFQTLFSLHEKEIPEMTGVAIGQAGYRSGVPILYSYVKIFSLIFFLPRTEISPVESYSRE